MVNKKKRNRQNGPEEEHGSDSTESWDDSQGTNGNAFGKCPHVQKAVDLTRVKKSLKTSGIAHECIDCTKSAKAEQDENDTLEDTNPGLWLCLRCGHQSCGRERRQHALKHFQTPRSDSHAVVVNTELWNVWCYECDLEVPATCRKKLHECLEFIKRQEDAPKVKKPASLSIQQHKKELEVANVGEAKSDVAETNGTLHSPIRTKEICPKDLPRVRGLRNIGNTCFFNAVLQCLGQTPFLLSVLDEVRRPGTTFTLPGGKIPAAGDEGRDLDLPPVEGVLGKLSTVGMTESLASILEQLRSSDVGAINPETLLKKLTVRCPQFAGYDQHDSHELLRHLLEGVRAEDLKRYQSAILNKLGLSEKVDPNQVDNLLRLQAKHYGRQASDLCLYPDQVFRGFLVSTLECQDCLHASQRVESFLDLSLPVMADKPQPPTVTRRKSNDDPMDLCSKDSQPSKHQQKKERKQARKGKKKGKGRVSESGGGGEPTIDEENVADGNNSGESEQTDADVEDNADADAAAEDEPGNDVSESGYCSEKAATESPADSPVSHPCAVAIPLPYGGASYFAPPDSLAVSIPSLPRSDRESPSSSDVNIDMAGGGELEGVAPSPADLDRPVSRFQFGPLDDEDPHLLARCSPAEEGWGGRQVANINLLQGLARVAHCSPMEEEADMGRVAYCSPTEEGANMSRVAHCSPTHEGADLGWLTHCSPTEEGADMGRVAHCNPTLEGPEMGGCSPTEGGFNMSSVAQWSPTEKGLRSYMGIAAHSSPTEKGPYMGRVAHCSPTEEGANVGCVAHCNPTEEGPKMGSCSWTEEGFDTSSVAQWSPTEKGPVSGLRMQLKGLGLTLRDHNAEDGVTQDEVESLISRLDEPEDVSQLAEGLRRVSLSGSGDVNPMAEVSPGPEDLRRRRGAMGDTAPPRERKEDSVAWGTTMGPKYTTDDGECSIQSCLNQFTAIELMTGNNKVGCENCTKRHNRGKEGKTVNTNATKQFLVSSPPPVLILHLKRFQMNRSVFKKLHRPVSFPLVLDLAPLIAAKAKGQQPSVAGQQQVVYSLYGIVEHSGHMAGGHYVAYVKVRPPLQPGDPRWAFLGREAKAEDGESRCEQATGGCVEPPPGKWYFVSDSQVNEVSEDRVLRSQAYLLFYERIW